MTNDVFVAEVTRTAWVTPGMVRVTLGGSGLQHFVTTGVGDEFVRLRFPGPSGELVLPVRDESGHWKEPAGSDAHIEPYTIRRHDPVVGEVDIDLVVHGHGYAATWAANAHAGDRLAMCAPRGLYEPPADASTQLFVTDETGIPALGRLAEQLEPGVHAVAAVEIAESSHRQAIGDGRMHVEWIVGRGNGIAPSAITEALKTMPITDECYVWVAGEAGELRHARRYLRHERGLSPKQYAVIGYWRNNQEEWLERYESLSLKVSEALQAIWDGADEEANRDLYEARLDALGL
jgi:NADPH-dependent ferric siderophore reductase